MATGTDKLDPLLPVAGVKLASVAAGVRYQNRRDVVLIELDEGAVTAGVYTQNAFCAAPVHVARDHEVHSEGKVRYLLINTGNANAGTGDLGLREALSCCQAVAELARVDVAQVLPFSTGVIGERLPVERIVASLPAALAGLAEDQWTDAAIGIMTTDTRPK